MVKTAVILAAGLGLRLKEKTKFQPKGFLQLEEKSLIQRSVDNLIKSGIEHIYIGTGYLSEVYEAFSQKYSQIECIKSDRYESTSSMYTLYNMREYIEADFLLLESDLLYEVDALTSLIEDEKEDIILASGATNSHDEVFIGTDDHFNLTSMSKIQRDIDSIYGELVGISKVSINRYKMMCDAFEDQNNARIDYEYIMVKTSEKVPFPVKKVDDLIWCEIDDANHLNRAMKDVLPRIKGKNGNKN